MPSVKYAFPEFLQGQCSEAAYLRWLARKAMAHIRRDRARGNTLATSESYKRAIHAAVVNSGGRDAYTGQPLRWDLISTFQNESAKQGRREYKKTFADLPTLDHIGDGLGEPVFVICSWRTNDCKSDLTREELMDFCRRVLDHHEGRKEPVG